MAKIIPFRRRKKSPERRKKEPPKPYISNLKGVPKLVDEIIHKSFYVDPHMPLREINYEETSATENNIIYVNSKRQKISEREVSRTAEPLPQWKKELIWGRAQFKSKYTLSQYLKIMNRAGVTASTEMTPSSLINDLGLIVRNPTDVKFHVVGRLNGRIIIRAANNGPLGLNEGSRLVLSSRISTPFLDLIAYHEAVYTWHEDDITKQEYDTKIIAFENDQAQKEKERKKREKERRYSEDDHDQVRVESSGLCTEIMPKWKRVFMRKKRFPKQWQSCCNCELLYDLTDEWGVDYRKYRASSLIRHFNFRVIRRHGAMSIKIIGQPYGRILAVQFGYPVKGVIDDASGWGIDYGKYLIFPRKTLSPQTDIFLFIELIYAWHGEHGCEENNY